MDGMPCDDEAPIAPATPEERQMAERIFDALKQVARNAFITGNPHAGRMHVTFDGEFNLISLVRLLSSPQERKFHNSEP